MKPDPSLTVYPGELHDRRTVIGFFSLSNHFLTFSECQNATTAAVVF